jgi:tetratricopeptide (TPR) repeat protein
MKTLLICAAILLNADAFEVEFQAGNAAYEAGDYPAAIQGYERVIASGGVDSVVFYNLGNAYYKAGQLGHAIANYERAMALTPGFAEAGENLVKAVGETANKLPRPLRPAWQQALLFWDAGLMYGHVRLLSIVAWLAFWGLLAATLLRKIPYARSFAVLFLGLAMLSGLSAWCKAHPPQLAVGVQAAAPVRYGMSDAEAERFSLAEGDRVAVEAEADGWLRVRSVDGVRGWIRKEAVCIVGPPYEVSAVPQPVESAT